MNTHSEQFHEKDIANQNQNRFLAYQDIFYTSFHFQAGSGYVKY